MQEISSIEVSRLNAASGVFKLADASSLQPEHDLAAGLMKSR
jgi:hypothetical protein